MIWIGVKLTTVIKFDQEKTTIGWNCHPLIIHILIKLLFIIIIICLEEEDKRTLIKIVSGKKKKSLRRRPRRCWTWTAAFWVTTRSTIFHIPPRQKGSLLVEDLHQLLCKKKQGNGVLPAVAKAMMILLILAFIFLAHEQFTFFY